MISSNTQKEFQYKALVIQLSTRTQNFSQNKIQNTLLSDDKQKINVDKHFQLWHSAQIQ